MKISVMSEQFAAHIKHRKYSKIRSKFFSGVTESCIITKKIEVLKKWNKKNLLKAYNFLKTHENLQHKT